MPVDINGWIEFIPSIYSTDAEWEDEYAWHTWMRVGSIIYSNDEINWILFGNPREFNNPEPEFRTIAKGRGFPQNPGPDLTRSIEEIIEFENKLGKGEFFAFTHVFYSEINTVNWQKEYGINVVESDWLKLFQLVDKFLELKNLSPEQIRITVWYNW